MEDPTYGHTQRLAALNQSTGYHFDELSKYILHEVFDWLKPAVQLRGLGMPPDSFEQVFEGRPEIMEQVWAWMKELAVWTDAFRARFDFHKDDPYRHIAWSDIDKVPESFPGMIRAIQERKLPIFFGEKDQFEPGSWNVVEVLE